MCVQREHISLKNNLQYYISPLLHDILFERDQSCCAGASTSWKTILLYIPGLKYIALAIPKMQAFKKSFISFVNLLLVFPTLEKCYKTQMHNWIAFKFSTY